LVKLDFGFNIFFVITAFYFMHCDGSTNVIFTLPFYGFFLILSLCSCIFGVRAVRNKDRTLQTIVAFLRVGIETFKIIIIMLILNCYNAAFEQSVGMKETLGKIKFSILVQEILSMALFIPIMMLGRQIFHGLKEERNQ